MSFAGDHAWNNDYNLNGYIVFAENIKNTLRKGII